MQSLSDYLVEQERDPTVAALATFMEQYFRDQCQPVLRAHHARLLRTFERAGEAAYGAYWGMLTTPLRDELAAVGMRTRPAFPGNLEHSSEEEGAPTDRERRMWYVVWRIKDDTPIGTLVVSSFHDHTRFRVLRAPDVRALDVTQHHEIVKALRTD